MNSINITLECYRKIESRLRIMLSCMNSFQIGFEISMISLSTLVEGSSVMPQALSLCILSPGSSLHLSLCSPLCYFMIICNFEAMGDS